MATSGVSARVLRDFVLAMRGRPFRIALLISLVIHLSLLVFIGRGGLGSERGAERSSLVMHVRLLPPEPSPVAVPAAPEPEPAVAEPPPAQLQTAAAEPLPTAPAAPEATVLPVPQEPVPAPEATVREEPQEQLAAAASAPPAVAAAPPGQVQPAVVALAPPSLISVGAGQVSPTPAVGVQGTGSTSALPAAATAGSGSGGGAAAGLALEGNQAAGGALAVGAVAGTGTPAAAATSDRPRPGSRDLAAVRRRIDAHKVYPPTAVRNGWEGSVLVEMHLEGDGRLATVRLLQSSGHALLDDETIAAVRRASPFPPIARVLTVPVEYRLIP